MRRKPGPGALVALALLTALPAAAAVSRSPRPLTLTVDATDAPRGVFHSHLAIPAAPGPLTLAYPEWIQGEHGPTGPLMQVAGFAVKAQGKILGWRRDPLDMFLVHVDVPAGADAVEVDFDYLSPPDKFGAGYGETPNATPHLLIADWHDLVIYPHGAPIADIPVRASLRLPAGWQMETALATESGGTGQGAVTFAPTTLYTLLDSPVLAGDYFRTLDVGPAERIAIAADRPSALAVSTAREAAYRRLPAEAQALFGGRHYGRYHWLVALAEPLENNGLEHHESSDNRAPLVMFTGGPEILRWASLLAHEYVHSWNGKYRRPAGLATSDPQVPLETGLLWVYEGMTRYLGDLVLSGRSGLMAPEESREFAAYVAANQDHNRPGRSWRPLADTAVAAQVLSGLPQGWLAARRSLDYYDESMLIWLEADTIIRQKSNGARSLDDFCRAFFGGTTAPAVVPYTFDDVVAALDRIAPYDWKGFFAARIEAVAPRAPLGGLEAAGWRLVYNGQPNVYQKARETSMKVVDASFSLGLWIKDDGTVNDVVTGAPAYQGGFGPGMKILAVNGRAWSSAVFSEELAAGMHTAEPLALAVQQGDDVRTLHIDYHGGPRSPHLERDPARPDLLSAILAPRAAPQP